jgi:pimeloyl-ACP methyl ester carboxylesterase
MAFGKDRNGYEAAVERNLMSLAAAKQRHVGTSPDPGDYDPDLWTDEYAMLSRPGETAIQSDLFYDYRTNVASYPQWQAWLRKTQPKTLVISGRYDPLRPAAEAAAYARVASRGNTRLRCNRCVDARFSRAERVVVRRT